MGAWVCTLLLLLAVAGVAAAAGSPLRDADAVWQFGKGDTGPRTRYPLTVHGAVKLGVLLTGEERRASLARGGDGTVARFEGGYLEVGGPACDPVGATFTLLLRVRDTAGAWNAPLFGSYGGDAAVSVYLRGVDGATLPMRDMNYAGGLLSTPAAWMFGRPDGPRAISGPRGVVECLWGSSGLPPTPGRLTMQPRGFPEADPPPLARDARNGVLRLVFAMAPLGADAWHDLIVRGTGAKIELWIDGVLVDEEFPVGATRPATAPRLFGAAQAADGSLASGFHGLMDHAALWRRALTVLEIRALSGGVRLARQRERAVLGAPPDRMQYYRARGHNSKAGDCIPFYHDGTFHLFYLVLRRNMHSKFDGGHGGLEIHHASTRDLVHWRHHPVVAPISEQWEAWNGTGGVVHRDGKFWWFYPTPDYDGSRGGIQLAVSKDGENYVKQTPHPFIEGGDCEVFADPDPASRLFHLVKLGKSVGAGLPVLKDKTLVCWASPADLDQHGAGLITVEGPGGRFDSIVLGEAADGRWMAGSDSFQRTQPDQSANLRETTAPGEQVQIAVVYAGRNVTLYRNGSPYAAYTGARPLELEPGARVLLGLRHLDRRGDPKAHFRGAIADARVYAESLTAEQVAGLRPHDPAGPKPLVWFDFAAGAPVDRVGGLAAAELEGAAQVRDGRLVLDGNGSRLTAGGRKTEMAHWVSEDLRTWRELPEPIITTDESFIPNMCPHWFQWNGWSYYIGGVNGIWRSRGPYGPWTLQSPGRLDALAVPKTGAFTGNRRIFAGFVTDDGWGGDLVLRELVQHPDGVLGTRFVPEMIPPTGRPLPPAGWDKPIRIDAGQGRRQILLGGLPNDVRITLTLAPQGTVAAYGLRLRTTDGERDGTELRLTPGTATASYSASTHSGSGVETGVGNSIDGLRGLDRHVRLDIICRHDLVDVEIDGRHTLVNRFWNPKGDRLGIWVEGGSLEACDVVIRPLLDHVPPGALRPAERAK